MYDDTTQYTSPLGNMLLAADAIGLTGAWFEEQSILLALSMQNTKNEKRLF